MTRNRLLMLTSAVTATAAAMIAVSAANAGPAYTFEFDPEYPPPADYGYNPRGGEINRFFTWFDAGSNTLRFEANFGHAPDYPNVITDAFTLVLTGGPESSTATGQDAIIYFDATGAAPIMTAYGYNGSKELHPWYDGRKLDGWQPPDRIASSLNDNSWLNDIFAVNEDDGTRTFGFEIDASVLNDHEPLYPGPDPWEGMAFGEKIGVFFSPHAEVSTAYDNNGWLSSWDEVIKQRGWFAGENFDTTMVPLPTPFLLSLFGLCGVVAVSRRTRQTRA